MMKRSKKIILSAVAIIALVGVVAFSYTFFQLSKISTVKISKTNEDLGIKPEVIEKKETEVNEIINIALFGVDRRTKEEASRSDSMIILSIDTDNKKIKMSSIMRDTYVQIKGHGETKINHAYAYGGPQLAIRTLNENFNLDIRDYVTVDFTNLEKIIDAIGGVTVEVDQDEISQIPGVSKAGSQNLNGKQAVAYSRIRHTSGNDFRRTERQRTILSVMFTKIQSIGVTDFPGVVSELLPLTETSMNSIDIIKLGTKVLTSNTKTLEQARFPVDGYWSGKTIDRVWYLLADMESTIEQLHNFIYDDIKPVAKSN
ncbi:LCP family protein [Clostridium sp.]|uniref:LCP family protein n=1 Tax=Clostridium sp. TaxID=1506 RepID=UPI003D6C97E9